MSPCVTILGSPLSFSHSPTIITSMAPTLATLKAGLASLKYKAQDRKNELLARLHAKEKISAEDEKWLD